jgi:hemerythrin-like metal-binding protein
MLKRGAEMTTECEYDNVEGLFVFGIPVLDAQHANLVRICGNLRMACLKGMKTANGRFQRAVNETADYARYHFSTEEKLMSILEYPAFDDHKKEHGDFIWEVLSRLKQFKEGEELLPEKFVNFLSGWIKNHIGVYDREFAEYFISMKHHGKLKLILSGRPLLSTNLA